MIWNFDFQMIWQELNLLLLLFHQKLEDCCHTMIFLAPARPRKQIGKVILVLQRKESIRRKLFQWVISPITICYFCSILKQEAQLLQVWLNHVAKSLFLEVNVIGGKYPIASMDSSLTDEMLCVIFTIADIKLPLKCHSGSKVMMHSDSRGIGEKCYIAIAIRDPWHLWHGVIFISVFLLRT